MSLITWDKSMSVGVAELDEQHCKLIALINELHNSMKERKAKEASLKIISGLVEYTQTHFSCEEQYFLEFNYSGTAAHVREHEKFVEKVLEFKRGYDEGRLMLSMEIMNFLRDWLFRHIQKTDQQYGSFFNEHGLR